MQSNIENSSKARDTIELTQLNDVYFKLSGEQWLLKNLWEYFTFDVPGANYMPSVKNKVWDGKIRLFNLRNRQLYVGLLHELVSYCEANSIHIEADETLYVKKLDTSDVAKHLPKAVEALKLPFELRDYQVEAITHALKNTRALLLSPTASGKSLIIYTLVRLLNRPTLIIVPTTSLVSQMYGDFKEYSQRNGWDVETHVHTIMAGVDKSIEKDVTITTWQSIYKMGKAFYERFDVVFGDEAHLFKAKSLTKILTAMETTPYRFGLTGSLDGSFTHELVLQGLFGKTKRVAKTKTLIDRGQLAGLNIRLIHLQYGELTKALSSATYQDEVDFIVTHPKRNQFITDLVGKLKGNTLVLYQFVEKHGKPLFESISQQCQNHDVQFVSGEVTANIRERIRKNTETSQNTIIVASMGTFSTGINIKNLHNIVFASPSKSQIRILQSIGRGLRKSATKTTTTLYDLVDDFSNTKTKNYAFDHAIERMKLYLKEGFDFNEIKVDLQKINARP